MENEIKVIRGFAVSMGNDYVEFFKNIEDAKNNYEMMKERLSVSVSIMPRNPITLKVIQT